MYFFPMELKFFLSGVQNLSSDLNLFFFTICLSVFSVPIPFASENIYIDKRGYVCV